MAASETQILMLNYEYPPLGGGAGNATQYLLHEFAERTGLRVTLITSSTTNTRVERLAENITIHFLDIGKRGSLHYQSNKNLLRYSWHAWRFCRRWIRDNPVDLVHAFFGIPGGMIALALGKPYIVSLRGSDVPFYNRRFYWLDRLVLKRLHGLIWRNAERVIANSDGLKALAQRSFPTQAIDVIPNGVDTQAFSPQSVQTKLEHLNLISIGRLIERKGYAYLFEALKDLENVSLTLVGDGNQKQHLQTLARQSGLQVTFLGYVAHAELPQLLRAADLFVLPSLNEGMPNAALEAMACGLPVILTDTGGSQELVKGNGIIVPKGDAQALRDAVLKYKHDPGLIATHGAKSRNIAENMSWKKVAESYLQIYRER
jgi:glycosyltransferase involved in cell wall biosynthesis